MAAAAAATEKDGGRKQKAKQDAPDQTIPVPMWKLMVAFNRLKLNDCIEVYWVDENEWRVGRVTLKWSDLPNGVFLHVTWPNRPDLIPEELNLLDKTVYNRTRFFVAGKRTEREILTNGKEIL